EHTGVIAKVLPDAAQVAGRDGAKAYRAGDPDAGSEPVADVEKEAFEPGNGLGSRLARFRDLGVRLLGQDARLDLPAERAIVLDQLVGRSQRRPGGGEPSSGAIVRTSVPGPQGIDGGTGLGAEMQPPA